MIVMEISCDNDESDMSDRKRNQIMKNDHQLKRRKFDVVLQKGTGLTDLHISLACELLQSNVLLYVTFRIPLMVITLAWAHRWPICIDHHRW